MSIIRGIRSFSNGYLRDFIPVAETEENIKSYISVETADNDDIDCYEKVANVWPESISLNARIIPEKFTSEIFVERIEEGASLGKNYIYKEPIIHEQSIITNQNAFCSKLSLKFENSGEYTFDDKNQQFFKNKFNEYEVKLTNDCLYEKNLRSRKNP